MYTFERVLNIARIPTRKTEGLLSLTVNYLLFQFAFGMVSMFGVVFIYQLAENFLLGIFYILLFFTLQRVVVMFVIFPVGSLVSKIGYRWMMIIGLIFLAVKLYFLSITDSLSLWPLVPALVFGGVAITAYYLAFHALFLDDNQDTKIGEQMGFLTMIGRATMIFSPLFAGLIVDNYGFSVMFLVATAILVFSFIPLLMMKHHKRHVGNYSFDRVVKTVSDNPRFSWSLYWWTFTEGIQTFLWPVLLLSVLGNYTFFGFVGSIVMVANSVSVYHFGKIYDKKNDQKVFLYSGVLVVVTWFARFMSITPVGISISDAMNRVVSPAWWMKIRRYELVVGERVDSLVFGAAHEFVVTFGIVSGLIVGSLILIFTQQWMLLILPVFLGTTIATVILTKKNDK